MTVNDVKVVSRSMLDEYEKNIGAPRHKENTRKIDRLTWITGIGLGILLTLQALLVAGVIHVSAK